MPRHPLFQAALDADEAYSGVIASVEPGSDRWTISNESHRLPLVQAAYTAKVLADRVWLEWMRANTTT